MIRYPSITSLRAFEAVYRLGSVTSAAKELSLTRSAISHQINMLEEVVGHSLTKRAGRGIALTNIGESYAVEAKHALAILLEASRLGHNEDIFGKLSISCSPGLANHWLCHHISTFSKKYSKLSLHVHSPNAVGDVSDEDIDVFITYGNGNWPDKYVRPLVTIKLFPVCSPSFLSKQGGIATPSDVANMTLLHLNSHSDWRVWLAANGVNDKELEFGITFSDATFVQSAALAGQGIAIGDNMTSGEALSSRMLVRPFSKSIESPRAYYLVVSPAKINLPEVQVFINWLEELVSDAQVMHDID